MSGIADSRVRRKGGTVDGSGMSEVIVEEVEEIEDRFRDRKGLEAQLQEIVRSKTPELPPSRGFWAKRRRKV